MLFKLKKNWTLPETAVTPENIYMNRRQWLQTAGFAGVGLATMFAGSIVNPVHAAIGLYPAPRNDTYEGGRALTPEHEATTYTNFY